MKNDYEKYIASEKSKQPKKQFFFSLQPPIDEMSLANINVGKKQQKQILLLSLLVHNSGEISGSKNRRRLLPH
ncbi:MAG: hypothetical protein R3B93_17250 [Bacteroidia bacterium]